MSRQLLGAALLSAVMASCSSTPSDPSPGHGSGVEQTGSISLPLTTEVGGVVFRLNKAQFTITGAALGKVPRIVKPVPDVPVHTEPLPAGSYSILLENGWVLERKGLEAGATFVAIQAKLITPNPVAFDVTGQATTDTWFNFVTSAGDVSLGRGNVDIHIGVQDCTSFDSVTAALATYTVDCTGTIGPDSFNVSKDGTLTRAFDSCPLDDGANRISKLESIDSLLSLQMRTTRLPIAKECLGGRFATFKAQFADSGILECPTWKKDSTVNPINSDTIGRVVPQLPKLPAEDNGKPLPVMDELKENNLYSVFFPSQVPPKGQQCETPADCATACAAGFPGFVISGKETTVLTDPVAWLIDTVFPGTNPFMRPGYYHPMSYYGGQPGVQFGHRNRALEFCSFYAGIHLQYPLVLDCLNPSIPSTCVSICAPPP